MQQYRYKIVSVAAHNMISFAEEAEEYLNTGYRKYSEVMRVDGMYQQFFCIRESIHEYQPTKGEEIDETI